MPIPIIFAEPSFAASSDKVSGAQRFADQGSVENNCPVIRNASPELLIVTAPFAQSLLR